MKILWVSHTADPMGADQGSRSFHLIHELRKHHEIILISWTRSLFKNLARGLGQWSLHHAPGVRTYRVNLSYGLPRWNRRDPVRPGHVALNQYFFRKAIKKILIIEKPHRVVYQSSHHLTGFPPAVYDCPVLFDYLDRSPDWTEKFYLTHSNAVTVVSPELGKRAEPYGKRGIWVPNGVHLERYRGISGGEVRKQMGFGNAPVVSLIGATASENFYFVHALARVQKAWPDMVFLLVGGGVTAERIRRLCRRLKIKRVVATGPVPYNEVHKYFAVTDVGLYAGDETPYFYGSCPLKILEYSAAGCPVVSSPVQMFEKNWECVTMVKANADAFADALGSQLSVRRRYQMSVERYDWSCVASQFEEALLSL